MKYKLQKICYTCGYNNYEPQTTSFFKKIIQENWIIFDCGAKEGYFTLIFSELTPTGIVHSFEPTITFDILKYNVEFNNISNAILNKMAVGNKSGKFEDNIFRVWGEPAERLEYDFITLDDYCENNNINKLDLIKIDVDSFDYEVLMGANNILKKLKPMVVVELNQALNIRGYNKEQVIEYMKNIGYNNINCLDNENFVFEMGD